MEIRADKMIVVRDSYTDEYVSIWETGQHDKPLALLTLIEAKKLRDELTKAIERKLPPKKRSHQQE
jgi:hypothetical protein